MRNPTRSLPSLLLAATLPLASLAAPARPLQAKPDACTSAIVEGDVTTGAVFAREFTPGLAVMLEPIASGWMLRVLDTRTPRSDHDLAEIATPPYRSVTPLALTTDFSFRAQDAIAWNPRSFRYAASRPWFNALRVLYPAAVAGQPEAVARLSAIVAAQPAGTLRILDARLAPGAADQAQMAATVASHFAETPHTVDTAAPSSPLGRIEWVRFRIQLALPPGVNAARGLATVTTVCDADATAQTDLPSHTSKPIR